MRASGAVLRSHLVRARLHTHPGRIRSSAGAGPPTIIAGARIGRNMSRIQAVLSIEMDDVCPE